MVAFPDLLSLDTEAVMLVFMRAISCLIFLPEFIFPKEPQLLTSSLILSLRCLLLN